MDKHRQLRSGSFTEAERAYWDRHDGRVSCARCKERTGDRCPKHGALFIIPHNCEDFR
jgi:hypothetical protein